MNRAAKRTILIGTAFATLFSAGVAFADVKAGVDAWSRGDYAAAVHEWQGPAAAGDPDALFNLGQAYRLGRGVPQDSAKAEEFYARAAAKGHLGAADTYGLMLFQGGHREAALPYLQDAARRGDPRAQYLLGIAHFNGDIVPKDWIRAYALVTLANEHNLPQAAAALAQMDKYIPIEQRQQAAALAVQLESQANVERGRALAAADLGTTLGGVASAKPPAGAGERVPHALETVKISPSVAAAQEALAEAREATGTESPARAGASFARRSSRAAQVAATEPPAPKTKQAASAASPVEPAAAPPRVSEGGWRVQLGAFGVPGNADKLWAEVGGSIALAGKAELKVAAGKITKLQVTGFASRDAAEDACRSLKKAGNDCLVTR
jgi:cell division protein FtsN